MYGGKRLLGPALALLGLIGVLAGTVSTVSAARAYYALHPRDVVAAAVVTQVLSTGDGRSSRPASRVMVEFSTFGGPVKEVLSVKGAKVGTRLDVTYDRENPAAVELTADAGSPDLWPGIPILLGGLLVAALGLGLVRVALRRAPLPAGARVP
jgi:hypothetical protein